LVTLLQILVKHVTKLQFRITDAELDEGARRKVEEEKSLHLRKAEAAQDNMKADFSATKDNKDIWTIAFDLQKTLPTPHIQTNVVFYSRQLWTYNLGIHDINSESMHIWAEDTASRGSEDIASYLLNI
jgi:hypothetical protein